MAPSRELKILLFLAEILLAGQAAGQSILLAERQLFPEPEILEQTLLLLIGHFTILPLETERLKFLLLREREL